MKLVFCDPGKIYISQVSGETLTAQVETTLKDLGYKTEVCLKWSGKGRGPYFQGNYENSV